MVPKRRPPRPHSCSRFKSPRRQCAAMKPRTVTSANNTMKTISAVTFTFDMRFSSELRVDVDRQARGASLERQSQGRKNNEQNTDTVVGTERIMRSRLTRFHASGANYSRVRK